MSTSTRTKPQPAATEAPAKKVCFLPDCNAEGLRVIEVEALPGVKADVPVCEVHLDEMKEAGERAAQEALDKAAEEQKFTPEFKDVSEEAPYGYCHVCNQAVGVLSSMPTKDLLEKVQPNGDVVLTWWEHIATPSLHCHEDCKCRDREVDGYTRLKHTENTNPTPN